MTFPASTPFLGDRLYFFFGFVLYDPVYFLGESGSLDSGFFMMTFTS